MLSTIQIDEKAHGLVGKWKLREDLATGVASKRILIVKGLAQFDRVGLYNVSKEGMMN